MSMRFHRVHAPDAVEEEPRRQCWVHVLKDEEDLRAALRRAAEFDQRAAETIRCRSARYRALLGEVQEVPPPAEQAS